MTFQSVPETAEIAVLAFQNGRAVQNTFHARFSGGYSTQQLTDMAAAIDDVIVASWRPIWTSSVSYLGTEVRGLELENDQVVLNTDGAGAGNNTNQEAPNSVAFAVRKLSGFTGRSARGRIYWFGIPFTYVQANGDFIAQTNADAIVAAVAAVRQAIIDEGATPVIVSRYNAGAKRATGITFVWATTSSYNLRLDSRRDRMPRE